jgi:hypothetical protein
VHMGGAGRKSTAIRENKILKPCNLLGVHIFVCDPQRAGLDLSEKTAETTRS